jgi:hypothetical protein
MSALAYTLPATHNPATFVERRGSPRRRMLKQARVLLNDRATLDCTIRDMSETGARLVFGAAMQLPETFTLLCVSAETRFDVRVAWRKGLAVGVAFIGPAIRHA